MKHLFTVTIAALLFVHTISAQDQFTKNDAGRISYTGSVTVEGSAEDLYVKTGEFAKENLTVLNRYNKGSFKGKAKSEIRHHTGFPMRDTDPFKSKTVEVAWKYTGGFAGCIRIMYIEADMKMTFKEGGYTYELTNFRQTHYNQQTHNTSAMWGNKEACSSGNDFELMFECDKCGKEFASLYNYLSGDIPKFISEFKAGIK